MGRQRRAKGQVYWEAMERRALAFWPRLNPKALRRCHHDPRRIARLIAHRTSLSRDMILDLLTFPELKSEETEYWFG